MRKIFFHIGARKNSQGVKNKNIKLINGKPLIQWSIEQAKKIKRNSKIIVSSDSKTILNLSKKLKVDFLISRPKNLSSSKTSKIYVWKHSVNYMFKKKLMDENDIFIDLDCTCPIRDINDIKLMIKKFNKFNKLRKKFDGIISITEARKNPYFNLVEKNKNNHLELSKKLKKNIVRRQDCPNVFEHVASIYVLKPLFILKKNFLMHGKLYGHLIKNFTGLDIDNKFDFKIVKYILGLKNAKY
tara:strand:- start:1968 stop:2693 length:726 start_codon:yes stop_codon:yes gene_type:complete